MRNLGGEIVQLQNIPLIDANVIIRYLIGDGGALADKAKEIMYGVSAETQKVFLKEIVIAEIIYVLEGVYNIEKEKVVFALTEILAVKSVKTENKAVIFKALQFYAENKIDFVDALLISYNHEEGVDVFSFDKKLNKNLI